MYVPVFERNGVAVVGILVNHSPSHGFFDGSHFLKDISQKKGKYPRK
jgi:hypothetical protein